MPPGFEPPGGAGSPASHLSNNSATPVPIPIFPAVTPAPPLLLTSLHHEPTTYAMTSTSRALLAGVSNP